MRRVTLMAAALAAVGMAGAAVAADAPRMVTYLGVTANRVDETLAAQLGLAEGLGLVVEYVAPKSPAAEAGLQRHDVLIGLDEQVLVNQEQLFYLVRSFDPGRKVDLTVLRRGEKKVLPATLGEQAAPVTQAAVTISAPFTIAQTGSVGLGDLMGGSQSIVMMSEGGHQVTLKASDADKHLTIKDRDGTIVFDGPVTTEEDRAAVPEEYRGMLEAAERAESMRWRKAREKAREALDRAREGDAVPRSSGSQWAMSDGTHSLKVVADEAGRRYLTATDAQSGEVLFEGYVDTEEERAAVPEAIRGKLDRMENRTRSIIRMRIEGHGVGGAGEE
jgi:hypothetical protein